MQRYIQTRTSELHRLVPVLVADEDLDWRCALREFLVRDGYRVIPVVGAQHGMSVICDLPGVILAASEEIAKHLICSSYHRLIAAVIFIKKTPIWVPQPDHFPFAFLKEPANIEDLPFILGELLAQRVTFPEPISTTE